MSAPQATAENLPAWLDYIGSVHFTEMELGLERVSEVARRLDCTRPASTVITVAGTNGKGSVVACLEAVLTAAGISNGSCTSPHIHRFNERIRLNQQETSDAQIVSALSAIDRARGDISLSYFEFATLAALLLIKQAKAEIAILEVGLGGRLDAVNLVDPDISVITSIELDHQQWLGDSREAIAEEKAGIMRPAVPFVCGDPLPPASLLSKALELRCPSYWQNQQFSFQPGNAGWQWRGVDDQGESRLIAGFEKPSLAATNIACALQVLELLPWQLSDDVKLSSLAGLVVPGRNEWCFDIATGRQVLLDVGHNPAAMELLAETLASWRKKQPATAQVIAVVAVMADKDIQDMARNLESSTDIWYIAELAVPRGLGLASFEGALHEIELQCQVDSFETVQQAYSAACARAGRDDLVLVTGSFFTVSAVRELTTSQAGSPPEVAA